MVHKFSRHTQTKDAIQPGGSLEGEKHMTQAQRVKRHLEDFGTITSLEAMREYGISYLPARIYDLRMDGLTIYSRIVSGVNRYKEKVSWNEYSLTPFKEEAA